MREIIDLGEFMVVRDWFHITFKCPWYDFWGKSEIRYFQRWMKDVPK